MESPEGLAFIQKIVTAAHFVFTKDRVASIYKVSTFLKLTGTSTKLLEKSGLSRMSEVITDLNFYILH